MNIFPNREAEQKANKNISNEIFGNRFHADQSLYEYLIEFLLVFASPKDLNGEPNGELRFHKKNESLEYYAETMMGLRRFIFFDAGKRDKSIPLDEDAYNLLVNQLKNKMEFDSSDKDKTILAIQDLLRGYAVVIKKRTWCAQQILPLCPELIFCEAMPNLKKRKSIENADSIDIDINFQFTQRNFLARGGELYYLHLIQALYEDSNDDRMNELNDLLSILLTKHSSSISELARFIQNSWYEIITDDQTDKEKLYQQYNLGYIPTEAYKNCGTKAVDELISYLSSDFQQIKKIEILAKGIMLQTMRMMYCAVCKKLNIVRKPWIVDMTNNSSKATKQIASQSFRNIEDDFKECINVTADEMNYENETEVISRIKAGLKESYDIFKSKGKEMRCIIPISGAFERMTLSEDLVRFIVLSLVGSGKKITYDMFLDRLFDNYGIVVGPKQYEKSFDNLDNDQLAIKNNLFENQRQFQEFLKSTGFLKELSDSTSLVINPYKEVHR